jgi:hypothetical protein
MTETDRAIQFLLQEAKNLRVEVDKVNADPPRTGFRSIDGGHHECHGIDRAGTG